MALKPVVLLAATLSAGTGVGVGLALGPLSGPDPVVVLATISTFDCPAGGVPEGELHAGDRVFAIGRDEDGDWLQVRDPRDRDHRVWVEARFVEADRAIDGLGIETCEDRGDVALPPLDQEADAGTGTGSGTGGGDGTTTDTTGPTILSASVTPADIWEQDGGGVSCGTRPRQATVSAQATDPSGIASLTASWSFATVNQAPKALPATFGPFPYQTISDQPPYTVTVAIVITARDGAGNSSSATRNVVLHSTAECFG